MVVLFLTVLSSCKTAKTVLSSGEIDSDLSVKQLIKSTQKQEANFKTLQSKLDLEYTEGKKSQSFNLTLRIEKDKAIWISATLGLARALITPDKVQFYDKLNNQFFDGDYKILSEILGTELDFFQVQSLLLGESILNLSKDTYMLSSTNNSYSLSPKKQKALYNLMLLFNPSHFKMDGFMISQPLENRQLNAQYKKYQIVKNQLFPEEIEILANQDNEEVVIKLEMKSISLNEDLRFPFRIPNGFKEIVLQ
ncbi:DUF4292 domain-containing protein [Paucihalobacter ruber]|uniref:DUF4292 domain-containing protein n=2 Tax=Paucihalobacter ruber TaxID=2567861 RepID=A0A506PPK0_9FLAO|nr:DUF4292 domain-containing protein [Paucihalobacter ruber]